MQNIVNVVEYKANDDMGQLTLFTSKVDKAWAHLVEAKQNLKTHKGKIREIKKNDAEYSKLKDVVTDDRNALKARELALRKDYSIDAIEAEIEEAKLIVKDVEKELSDSIVSLRKVSPQDTINVGGSEKKIVIKATLANS